MRDDLPTGTVTFLFTDVEGSTKLLEQFGTDRYAEALALHRTVIRQSCAVNGGVEVDTEGDGFFFAFATAQEALAAAAALQQELAGGPIRVRAGVHTGTPLLVEDKYVGMDVHRAARIAAAGHGGQVLVSAATAALTGTDGLRDLGEHRFKDLSAPERVYQLGEREFPALKSLYQTNLPVPVTPFVGRVRELREVVELVRHARLVTLTGPGGTGKTRLAAQAAAELADDHPDGVFWVPLAALRDPQLVLETASQTIGVRDSVSSHIGGKRLLLLFDNFEQVADAASELAHLSSACPNLRLLVTSREPLRVSGEQEYPVPPLAHDEAVAFFVGRARAVRPDFEADGAISEICRRLDQLPLALELAAARIKVLSPQQILQRLDKRLPLLIGGARDLPKRQQTLKATIDWSHDLLSADTRQLFARLAVFAGGCTFDAADKIADAEVDTLQSLVDKSLLRHSGERFWMLETIREYALEQLAIAAELDVTRDRHARYFRAFAHNARDAILSGRQIDSFAALAADHDNLRAALEWTIRSRDSDAAIALIGDLRRFWEVRGHVREAGTWVCEALALEPEKQNAQRGRAFLWAANFALFQGDYPRAQAFSEAGLAMAEEIGDSALIAGSLTSLGTAAEARGDYETAQTHLATAVSLFRDSGDYESLAITLNNLGYLALSTGDYGSARDLCDEALDLNREHSDDRGITLALLNLGIAAIHQRQDTRAVEFFEESLGHAEQLEHSAFAAFALEGLAAAAARLGDAAVAAELLGAAKSLLEAAGVVLDPVERALHDATLATARSIVGDDDLAAALARGAALTFDQAIKLGHAVTANQQ